MELKEKLELFKERGYKYDPETGLFYNPDKKVITGRDRGYILLLTSKNNKTVKVRGHQFAWYSIYNEVPKEIDHINRDKSDNRISNLRNITHQKNMFNINTYKGYSKHHDKYRASITINSERIYLGRFDTQEEAGKAYLEAKKQYHKI